jgi:metal-responsive CopG/Arc/MetJ family transcriptional regulator
MLDMKRITVTLPDQIAEALEEWASQQGRPTANLASFLIEQGIVQAQEKGSFHSSTSQKTVVQAK